MGFPRDCGPAAPGVRYKWNQIPDTARKGGQLSTAFYVRSCPHLLPLSISMHAGSSFVLFCVLAAGLYLVPGMLLEHRRTGAKGLAALPHRAMWLQLHGRECRNALPPRCRRLV